MDRITQIYILFYPNCEKDEEDGEALVFEVLKYIGTFYSLYVFLELIHILQEQEQHLELEKREFSLGWNGRFDSNNSL